MDVTKVTGMQAGCRSDTFEHFRIICTPKLVTWTSHTKMAVKTSIVRGMEILFLLSKIEEEEMQYT